MEEIKNNKIEDAELAAEQVAMPAIIGNCLKEAALPPMLRRMVSLGSNGVEKDMLLLSSLVAVGSCLPKYVGRYDRRKYKPSLFMFIAAPASSGKGCVALTRNLVKPVDGYLRGLAADNILDYERLKQEAEKAGEHFEGKEPAEGGLLIAANSSASAFTQTLEGFGGRGLVVETEGDTMAYALKMDMGNYSPVLRSAWQHETISMLRRKNNERIVIENPSLSVILTGTPAQIEGLIPSTENGLFSRFVFWSLGSDLNWKDVFANLESENTADEEAEGLGKELLAVYKSLEGRATPLEFALSKAQRIKFNARFRQLSKEYCEVYGADIVPSVRRLAVSVFRMGMVLGLLRSLKEGSVLEGMKDVQCTDEDFVMLMGMAEVLIEHISKVYIGIPKKARMKELREQAEDSKPLTMSQTEFYAMLPNQFTTAQAHAISKQLRISRITMFRALRSFVRRGMAIEKRYGYYEKV